MPPQLALLLCTIFVLFLLWLDSKRCPDVSLATWIPTIWLLSIVSKPLGLWFIDVGYQGDPDEGSPLDRGFLVAILLVGFYILFKRRFNWSHAIKNNKWLLLLIGFMLISILWSDIPYVSFKRWIRQLLAVIMAFLILSERNPRQVIESILRRTAYIAIPYSLLLIKYFRDYGVEYSRWEGGAMFVGVSTQKNGLSLLCLIAIIFFVWSFVMKNQKDASAFNQLFKATNFIVLCVAIYLLMQGGEGKTSATSNVTLIVGLTALLILKILKKYKINIGTHLINIFVSLGFFFGTMTLFEGGANFGAFTEKLGRDSTLTGRTETWAELVPVAMQQPIIGHGFDSFWIPRTIEYYQMSHAHNGYLEILLELGFSGLFFFYMFLMSCCRKAQEILKFDHEWGSLFISFLIMLVIFNVAESHLNSLTRSLAAIVMIMSVSLRSKLSCSSV